jgi:hypothetical protein
LTQAGLFSLFACTQERKMRFKTSKHVGDGAQSKQARLREKCASKQASTWEALHENSLKKAFSYFPTYVRACLFFIA